MGVDRYILIDQCKDGFLYIIDARNADIGVYIAEKKAFKISRTKFRDNFIDYEDHWDTCEQHGTAKPLKEIEKIEPMDDEGLLIYLNKKRLSCIQDIKLLLDSIVEPTVLIDAERMKKLRMFQ